MIGAIILAAGSSSRLGQSKQKLEYKGISFLEHTTRCALTSDADCVMVVLGAQAGEHKKIISELPVEVTINPHWERGMGNSLKAGLKQFIENHPQADGVGILVCDQPFLTPQHLNALIREFKFHQGEIVASLYGTPGVPAIFSKKYFPQLLLLDDAEGAKKILARHKESLKTIPFPLGEIDIDTPADLNKLIGPAGSTSA